MKKTRLLVLMAIMILSLGLLAACGGKDNNSSSSGDKGEDGGKKEEPKTEEKGEAGSLKISGSSAMQPLVAAAAEEYKKKNANADIQVAPGGSGQGLSDVSKGNVDIGNSDVFAEEKEGIPANELTDHKIAVVGMAPVVNPETGVKDISKADLIKVFTGEIKNWKELKGKDQKIVLVNRPDSSGTRATFVKYALDGKTPAEGVTEESSNTVKKIISETEGAIGYLAFSYLKDDTVTALSVDGVEAKEENVINGEFPIWAYQHSYTKGEPKGLAKEFIDFMMTDEIQEGVLKKEGYIPANKMKVERDAEGKQTDKK